MTRSGILALLATVYVGGVSAVSPPQSSGISSPLPTVELAQEVEFERHFQELEIEGSILIYDRNRDRSYQHNPSRNATAFSPASTFKIFNSLVALETGVIQNETSVLTWDGIPREFPTWNRDFNLRQAFRYSAVWFYQVIARRVGHPRMQDFIEQVGFGNGQIGTAEDIDTFWLNGELKIAPEEQIAFLRRLERNNLPFSQRTIEIVKDIMIFEQTPDYVLRGKTGWALGSEPGIGWFVGYLEQNNNTYFFATTLDISNSEDLPLRIEVTRRCLQDIGLL